MYANKCFFPEELYYDILKHVWIKDEGNNVIRIGMTDVAVKLAGRLAKVSIKPIGSKIKKDKAVAIIESGKWVGPLPAPLSGEIIEINEKISEYPHCTTINKDPYKEGWIAKLKVEDFQRDKVQFKTGKDAIIAYQRLLEEENINCE